MARFPRSVSLQCVPHSPLIDSYERYLNTGNSGSLVMPDHPKQFFEPLGREEWVWPTDQPTLTVLGITVSREQVHAQHDYTACQLTPSRR